MNYEGLIKALRICVNTAFCNECPLFDTCENDNKLKLDAAAAIEALQAEVPKRGEWVRVEDELPNDGDWAIFTNGKVVSVERFKVDAYNHFFPASEWFDFEDAIAWMPLPEPPKEVQE